jgi:hypothetical protein
MNARVKLASKLGCLLAVFGPVAAVLLYPRAPWLFALFLLGIAAVILNIVFRKDPSPIAIADHAQRLLDGNSGTWDVDEYENLNPRDNRLCELWRKTLEVGGLPEEWVRLDQSQKEQLQIAINAMRQLALNE